MNESQRSANGRKLIRIAELQVGIIARMLDLYGEPAPITGHMARFAVTAIQEGMAMTHDLTPMERDTCLATMTYLFAVWGDDTARWWHKTTGFGTPPTSEEASS